MKWSMLWDLSVHNTSLPIDHTCCLGKSELEARLRFPVSENRNRKLRSESSFLFPLHSIVQFDVVHQHLGFRHKQHTNSCEQHVHHLRFFVVLFKCGNSHFSRFFFFVSRFDIHTRFLHWFDVITNWCYISIQSFRWTCERTALPHPFPDCCQFFAR